MKKELIDYSALVDNAMHLIVKKSLEIFAKNNVDSDHHFFISFITKYPGVVISDKLHNKYPYEMTIVLQYQFEDLIVNDEEFSVSLSFDNQREQIKIPFAALTAFADPSVKFGLQFRHIDEEKMEDDYKTTLNSFSNNDPTSSSKDKAPYPKKAKTEGNVISLDFKNKKLQ